MGKVDRILLYRHVCCEGGGRDTEHDSSHSKILQSLTRTGPPNEAVKIAIRLGELDGSVHLAHISNKSYMVESE